MPPILPRVPEKSARAKVVMTGAKVVMARANAILARVALARPGLRPKVSPAAIFPDFSGHKSAKWTQKAAAVTHRGA